MSRNLAGSQGNGPPPSSLQSGSTTKFVAENLAPTNTPEACWFATAHLFNAPPAKGTALPHITFAVSPTLLYHYIEVLLQGFLTGHFSLPYRSPPSQPLLQIFRI